MCLSVTRIQDVLAVVSLFEEAGILLGMSLNTSVAVRQRQVVTGVGCYRGMWVGQIVFR